MKISKIIFLLLIIWNLVSCVRYEPTTVNYLTLYNLTDVSSIEIELKSSIVNYAKINTQLEDGTIIKGDILLNQTPPPIRPQYQTYDKPVTMSEIDKIQKVDSTFLEKKFGGEKTYPELYGFSKNSTVSPKGSATIIVGSEKIIQIIFYEVDYRNQFGSGIGNDNEGNLYRVYLTTEIY